MPIKPIDSLTSINKVQKVATQKQHEISKGENIVYHEHNSRDKKTMENMKKVINTEKKEFNLVTRDRDNQQSNKKRQDKFIKKEDVKDDKEVLESKEPGNIGNNVDIRI